MSLRPSFLDSIHWFVLSMDEPHRVAALKSREPGVADRCWWYVGKGQRKVYVEAGAAPDRVVEGGYIFSANHALRNSQGKDWACMLSGDVHGLYELPKDPKVWRTMLGCSLSLPIAASRLISALSRTGASVGGIYPNTNAGFAMQSKQEWSLSHLLVGDFLIIRTDIGVKFQSKAHPKSDFAFTCACLATHGLVVRLNYILLDADHHTPTGAGRGSQRGTADRKAISYLHKCWPHVCSKNHMRSNEVILTNGRLIAKTFHPDVADAAEDVEKALPQHPFGNVADFLAQVRNNVNSGRRSSAQLSKLTRGSSSVSKRRNKRRSRGQLVVGAKREAGRRKAAVGAVRSRGAMNKLCTSLKRLRETMPPRPKAVHRMSAKRR